MSAGACGCGCGQPTKVARYSDARHGYVAGAPRPYVRGHNRLTSGTDPVERFWSLVTKTEGCWFWTGRVERTGYGRLNLTGGRRVLVHRFSYEMAAGPILHGLTIDHLCRERTCVNPSHMEVVTRAENTRRAQAHIRARRAGQVIDALEPLVQIKPAGDEPEWPAAAPVGGES